MNKNWYIVLELDFDPAVMDEAVIEAQIKKKKEEWTKLFNHPEKKAQSREWVAAIDTITRDMIGENQQRKAIAEDAKKLVYPDLDKTLKRVGASGKIPSDAGAKIAKSLGFSVDIVKKRCQSLKLQWVESGNDKEKEKEVLEKYLKKKPANAVTFEASDPNLKTFAVADYYEFLYLLEGGAETAKNLPCEVLTAQAEKRKGDFRKDSNVSTDGKKLCNNSLATFATEEKKKEYDTYVEFAKRRDLFKRVQADAKMMGMELNTAMSKGYMEELTKLLLDPKLAQTLFQAYCNDKKISLERSGGGQTEAPVKVCRCGLTNDVSDGRKICAACGLDLDITCPKCKAVSLATVQVCKCGFPFANLDKAIALVDQAERALSVLDFTLAKSHLQSASSFWSDCPKLATVRQALEGKENEVGALVGEMRVAASQKKYFYAKKQLEQIQKRYPDFRDESLEIEIASAIQKAESAFTKGKSAKNPTEVLEHCQEVFGYCEDYPGVKELLPMPEPLQQFKVLADGKNQSNVVTWQGVTDRSLRYVVRRSDSGWIQNETQGELLYQGNSPSYTDQKIEAGKTYFYNVFAERLGVFSKGAVGEFAEVVNLFHISHVQAVGGSGSVSFSWARIPNQASVEIYAVESGQKSHLTSTQGTGHLVSNLQNGRNYEFYLALSYVVSGKKVETAGLSFTATPNAPPEAVDSLRVRSSGETGKYDATWYKPEEQGVEVRLYGALVKPSGQVGDIVTVAEIERSMAQLQTTVLSGKVKGTLKGDEVGVGFSHNGADTLYVVAVVVKGDIAVLGNVSRASVGGTVTVKSVSLANGKLAIVIDPIPKATGFVVLYRFDRYPEDLGDKAATKHYISKKQYETDSVLMIPNAQEQSYYFSIFAEFAEGGSKDYSVAGEIGFDNGSKSEFSYSISVSGAFKKKLKIQFTSTRSGCVLPALDIMLCDTEPMFKEDCSLYHQELMQAVEGDSVVIELPYDKKLKGKFIKPYFFDKSMYQRNTMRLASGASHQIK